MDAQHNSTLGAWGVNPSARHTIFVTDHRCEHRDGLLGTVGEVGKVAKAGEVGEIGSYIKIHAERADN